MSPLQYAEAACSNMKKGRCMGYDFDETGKPVRHPGLKPNKECMLKGDKKCPFFDEVLLPQAKRLAETKQVYRDVVNGYRRMEK